MTAARRGKRAAARKPAPRTTEVKITSGDFAGWECTARVDFPARILADLESGKSLTSVLLALDIIVVDHNFPNVAGEVATSMGDVDPYRGLIVVAGAIFDALGKLPPR